MDNMDGTRNDLWAWIVFFITITIVLLSNSCVAQENKHNLNDEAYYIMVRKGTERRFSSPLTHEKRDGVYISAATGDTLFYSSDKFNSRTGWPSFDAASDKVDLGPYEQGGREVIEKSTGYHLGHIFYNEGFTTKNKRFCINGGALIFKLSKARN